LRPNDPHLASLGVQTCFVLVFRFWFFARVWKTSHPPPPQNPPTPPPPTPPPPPPPPPPPSALFFVPGKVVCSFCLRGYPTARPRRRQVWKIVRELQIVFSFLKHDGPFRSATDDSPLCSRLFPLLFSDLFPSSSIFFSHSPPPVGGNWVCVTAGSFRVFRVFFLGSKCTSKSPDPL